MFIRRVDLFDEWENVFVGCSGSFRLAFIEDHVGLRNFKARVSAVLVALEMGKHKGDNSHA